METLFYHFLKLLFFFHYRSFLWKRFYLPWTGLEPTRWLSMALTLWSSCLCLLDTTIIVTLTQSTWNRSFCFALFAIQTSHTPHKQSPCQSCNPVASTEHSHRSSSANSRSKLWYILVWTNRSNMGSPLQYYTGQFNGPKSPVIWLF